MATESIGNRVLFGALVVIAALAMASDLPGKLAEQTARNRGYLTATPAQAPLDATSYEDKVRETEREPVTATNP